MSNSVSMSKSGSMPKLMKTGYILFWIVTLAVALISWRFFALGLEQAFNGMLAHIQERQLAFILHVFAAPIALAAGLFQFLPNIRSRRPHIHRWCGRLYMVAVGVAGVAGLILALGAFDRPVAGIGFLILAVLWLSTTGRAVWLAMQGRIKEHRRWIIRSWALTLAAVTLRIYLPFFMGLGQMEYAEASIYVAWACWAPNLIVAELYLRRSHRHEIEMIPVN
jgi:uncharacterized membrane protein